MNNFKVISRKWSRQILSLLRGRERGFKELMEVLTPSKPLISTRTLSDRLKEMEGGGFIEREVIASRPPRSRYTIAGKGREALRLIDKLDEL